MIALLIQKNLLNDQDFDVMNAELVIMKTRTQGKIDASFHTFDTSAGCVLCGQVTCRGNCFK